jgi:exo-beta-1,3-glucanase (GH17 family)
MKRLGFSHVLLLWLFMLGQNFSVIADFALPKRELPLRLDGQWIGAGVSYGPYRDGESPDLNSLTSEEHIDEDLNIMLKHWNLIRLYGSGEASERILSLIKKNNYPMRVMLGAWIDGHWTREKNDEEVERAIRLAKAYPEIVIAVNIGNEIFVDWSYHRMRGEEKIQQVIGYIRKARNEIEQPVTVCDDYNFWNKPESKRIAAEIDFIGLHAYAFWNSIPLKRAVPWTKSIFEGIQKLHPSYHIALCESGWPTSRVYNDGSYEGNLIGKAGIAQQQQFLKEYDEWILKDRITSFLFEAFDEKWKGGFDGDHPMDKCEKHWGVYNSQRQLKGHNIATK